ncbi:CPBP family intramembrane metalloprotease [Microbacterium sp. SSW1-47]|uniref:CPBP family intramembrane glutamic endopeptidase n=1 Tax=Microbacterium sufflavum TaxID=2851649 RepID=UPI001FFD583D|nr:type II CAAX endopeptidase family protein [Microbacterium sufflavum]MCK2025079.1 CPBP family intramembrane metalloprotease [Microbacterium sufflavum]
MSHSDRTTAANLHDSVRNGRVTWPDLWLAAGVAIALYAIGILLYLQMPDDDAVAKGLALFAISGLAPSGGVLAMIALRRRPAALFGITRVAPRWLAIAFMIGIGVVALNLAVTALVSMTTDAADLQSGYQSAATSGIGGFLGAILLGAVLTPIGEELLFRGVLFTLLTRYGVWLAAILSSIVFALSHGLNLSTPVAVIVGLASAWLMHKTKSVWPGVVVHAVNNASSSIVSVVYVHLIAG